MIYYLRLIVKNGFNDFDDICVENMPYCSSMAKMLLTYLKMGLTEVMGSNNINDKTENLTTSDIHNSKYTIMFPV